MYKLPIDLTVPYKPPFIPEEHFINVELIIMVLGVFSILVFIVMLLCFYVLIS